MTRDRRLQAKYEARFFEEILRLPFSTVSLAIEENTQSKHSRTTQISTLNKTIEIDWDRVIIEDISLEENLVVPAIHTDKGKMNPVVDIYWIENDEKIIAELDKDKKFAFIDAINGNIINILEKNNLPNDALIYYGKTQVERTQIRLPKNAAVEYSEKTGIGSTVYLGYSESAVINKHWLTANPNGSYLVDFDSLPGGNIAIYDKGGSIFKKKGRGLYVREAYEPYDRRYVYSFDNEHFKNCKNGHPLKISNMGDKLAVGNEHNKHNFSIIIFDVSVN